MTGTLPDEPADAREPSREGSDPAGSVGGAVRAGRANWPLFLGLALVVVVADQLSKQWIVTNLEVGQPIQLVGDYLRLRMTHNSGALFGLFREQAAIFAAFSIVVIGLIAWYHGHLGRNLLASVALGLLLGGALGNLADRLQYGYVVDFVDAGIGDLRFYTFNVADSAISCAILLLILMALRPGAEATRTDG